MSAFGIFEVRLHFVGRYGGSALPSIAAIIVEEDFI
jgi:hypothetical protein